MDIFNVVGRLDIVSQLAKNHRIVDRFPVSQGNADWNIETSDAEATDSLVQFCEENSLKCELVG